MLFSVTRIVPDKYSWGRQTNRKWKQLKKTCLNVVFVVRQKKRKLLADVIIYYKKDFILKYSVYLPQRISKQEVSASMQDKHSSVSKKTQTHCSFCQLFKPCT